MKFVIHCKSGEAKEVVRDSEATSYPCEDGEEGRLGEGWGRAARVVAGHRLESGGAG